MPVSAFGVGNLEKSQSVKSELFLPSPFTFFLFSLIVLGTGGAQAQ